MPGWYAQCLRPRGKMSSGNQAVADQRARRLVRTRPVHKRFQGAVVAADHAPPRPPNAVRDPVSSKINGAPAVAVDACADMFKVPWKP
jgi:hypothetical protein